MLDAVIYVLLLSVCLLPQYHMAIAAQISKSDNFYPLFVVVTIMQKVTSVM